MAFFIKNRLFIVSLFLLACNSQTKQVKPTIPADTPKDAFSKNLIDNTKYYTTKDTLTIASETGEPLKYSKQEYNLIVDTHPELFDENVEDPDPTYYCKANRKGFTSEAGQDEYYALYAYCLKQRNGLAKYHIRRKKLIEIYNGINSLFQRFQYGGTFFAHQYYRIEGYAEYSVYLYKQYEDRISKTYDIARQKDLYISSLRQLVDDEVKIDTETPGSEKIQRKKELNGFVDEIDKAITDNFYLRRAQEFQYEHYQYY